jgi:hypothetical protein
MANEISIVVRTTDAASKGFSKIGEAATGMNSAIESAGSALDSIDAIQQSGTQKANRLARAQLDVEQAMVDGEQATVDLTQAQLDLNQSEIDGAQAGVDLEQARIDAKQADLDATVAVKEYNAAVKEHGRNSEEARQAGIDLAQAQADLTQANLDSKQATADAAQAQSDAKQATTDMSQASIDARSSQVDLNEAQAAMNPTLVQQASLKFQELAPALGLAALAGQSVANSMNLTRVRTVAATAATKAMVVVQKALNIVMRLNPLGLVITAIALLVGGLILAYKRSDTFRAVVDKAFRAVKIAAQIMWQGLKAIFSSVGSALSNAGGKFRQFWSVSRQALSALVSFARSVPGRIRGAFSTMYGIITNPIRNAVNAVKSWLSGLISYARSIPSRIGNSIKGAIPGFAHGGVVGQAASGGLRGSWTMTGERGPELLQLPPGTRVRSNSDTRRMVSNRGMGDAVSNSKKKTRRMVSNRSRLEDAVSHRSRLEDALERANALKRSKADARSKALERANALKRSKAVAPSNEIASYNPDTGQMGYNGGTENITITLIIRGTGILEGLRETIRVKGGNVQAVLGQA